MGAGDGGGGFGCGRSGDDLLISIDAIDLLPHRELRSRKSELRLMRWSGASGEFGTGARASR